MNYEDMTRKQLVEIAKQKGFLYKYLRITGLIKLLNDGPAQQKQKQINETDAHVYYIAHTGKQAVLIGFQGHQPLWSINEAEAMLMDQHTARKMQSRLEGMGNWKNQIIIKKSYFQLVP